jgi:toluene monooxygenase system ferredoxin subunit
MREVSVALERVTELADLWVGEMRGCRVSGQPVLLVRLEDGVWAFADRCAHLGVALSGGSLDAGVITCPAHHYCYDARTGAGINPNTVRLRRLPVQIRDGVLYVDPTEDRA